MADRRLVACEACHRQFEVSGRRRGEQFHCSCGEVLTVTDAQPHDAAVVKCSSCGAPRERGALACAYCNADFTLHERDLHTICPKCLARISDRARYCHDCGTLIAPSGHAGDETERHCPACGEASRLYSRSLGGRELSVLECGRCAGLWLGNEVFRHLERGARKSAATAEMSPPAGASGAASDVRLVGETARYRPCPVCSNLMHRRNYGRRSGMIIDTCQLHGLWFDQGELAAILDWIHTGGLDRAERHSRQLDEEEGRLRRVMTGPDREADSLLRGSGRGPRGVSDLIEAVLRFLSS